jgi:TnpA family transposase
MKGDYPRFKASYQHEELVEYFLLHNDELEFISSFRGDVNRNTVAVLLKSLLHMGYFPESLEQIPNEIRAFVASQLNLLWDHTPHYRWSSSSKDHHLALIRDFTGWRFPTAADKETLEEWLLNEGAINALTEEDLLEVAYARLGRLQIELPSEKELRRIVNAALNGFFQNLYTRITSRLSESARDKLDHLLVVPEGESFSDFEKLKSDPAAAGVNNLKKEIAKLKQLRAIGIAEDVFTDVPFKALQILKRRARNEKASEMREHPEHIRYALMACFIHLRAAEVVDDITRMTIELIHKIDSLTEKQVNRELLHEIKRVEGKVQILFRVAEAVTEQPDGTVREVIFPIVKEDVFTNLVAEFKTTGPQYRLIHQFYMHNKYARHYRQMLPLVLQNLTFRSENRFQPIIKALEVIKRYANSKHQYFPEDVPIEGVVTRSWTDTVIENKDGKQKINRKYYELCVLQKLKKALKCKEVWVEGSYAFRNPSQDMPVEWADEEKRSSYYQTLKQPVEAHSFIDPLRKELTDALTAFNRSLPRNPHVRIYYPNNKEERGLFAVPRLEARPEPQSIGIIKDAINRQYEMLDLLDVFVEADRLTNFTRFFTHSGTKEVRSREALRPLIILDLFAEGTNTGIKRVAKANHDYSYNELLYVRKTYFSIEALRCANVVVVNKILALRDPRLWGEGNACASDGKRFESWSQNLMTEWRSRYKGYGVLVYWHVDTNAVCIYSQLRSFSSSEVAAMIEGLIKHDTEMRVEKNFVDSHGQSEVAFAFCRLLGGIWLMPRLKRIKYERLYLPDNGMIGDFPNLAGVLTRPIRWPIIEQQYDEMVKHAVALKTGTATPEAILKRFNSYNVTHPTYKGLAELGKVEKTIYLCDYLSLLEMRYEVQEGLNVVERWNGTNDFISYGKQGVFATNSREQQEITTLSLQLLQNCLMLINTILVQRTIAKHNLLDQLSVEDMRALTPLFYEHINPYGLFELDLERPSFLKEAA